MLEAQIGAKRAHVDGIIKSIEMMQSLTEEASGAKSSMSEMQGSQG